MTRTAGPAPVLTPEAFELEADALRALAHPKRLMILARIGEGEVSVSELSSSLGLSLPNVSQHLRVLRDRRIVRADRAGQVVRYRLTNPLFSTCCAMVRQLIVQGSSPDATRSEERPIVAPGPGPG